MNRPARFMAPVSGALALSGHPGAAARVTIRAMPGEGTATGFKGKGVIETKDGQKHTFDFSVSGE